MENNNQRMNKNVSLSLIAEYGASDSDSDDTETRSNNTGNESDAPELSEMVLKNNIINACAHGPLSRSEPDEEVTRHMIIDSSDRGIMEYEVTEYRDADSESNTSSSSDSSDSEVDSVKDADGSSGEEFEVKNAKPEAPKVNGELGLDDLPPIEDLAISLPAQDCTKIGKIASIVDRLVIVQAFPETPAVDIDSVLFVDNGAKALGKVFDVFGPITEPHYCIRFNSLDHVKERGIQTDMEVFIAPKSQHTNYVFLSELMKVKGCDASWLNDIEPPPSQIDYSDDEEERRANRARKNRNKDTTTQEQPVQNDGETSRTVRKPVRSRPSEWNSRFGSGPSRGRNPFAAGARRYKPPSEAPIVPTYTSSFNPRTPPSFNPRTPPPFSFQFGGSPRLHSPFRTNAPVLMSSPGPHWLTRPPPPPGT